MDEAVTVSMVETSAEAHEAAALLGRIWASPRPIVPADLLFALVRVRNYAALARVGPEVVGASVAIRGVSGDGSPLLHSHVTGTTRPGVGRILKEHQRQWALAEGLPTITWTVDPLLRRNAVFNLDVLGARVDGYRVNHYGSMTDGRNSGEESDRFCVVWDLDPASPAGALPAGEAPTMGRPARPSPESASSARYVVRVGERGEPVVIPAAGTGHPLLVEIPQDIEAVRVADRQLAAAWRLAVRAELGERLQAGWRLTALVDRSAYLILPPNHD